MKKSNRSTIHAKRHDDPRQFRSHAARNRDALLSCALPPDAGSIDIISGLHETRTESTMRFRVCIGPPRQAAHSNAKSVCARLGNASEIVHRSFRFGDELSFVMGFWVSIRCLSIDVVRLGTLTNTWESRGIWEFRYLRFDISKFWKFTMRKNSMEMEFALRSNFFLFFFFLGNSTSYLIDLKILYGEIWYVEFGVWRDLRFQELDTISFL